MLLQLVEETLLEPLMLFFDMVLAEIRCYSRKIIVTLLVFNQSGSF
jgi:hypothetical protein